MKPAQIASFRPMDQISYEASERIIERVCVTRLSFRLEALLTTRWTFLFAYKRFAPHVHVCWHLPSENDIGLSPHKELRSAG
jgi:hypothetical protein